VVHGTTGFGPVTAVVDVVGHLAPPIVVCTTFDRSELTGPWNQAVTARKAGIEITRPAQTHSTWHWTFSDEPLNVISVSRSANGGTQPAGTSPGTLQGRYGSDIMSATFCTSGPAD
jgi:hypothetical protein